MRLQKKTLFALYAVAELAAAKERHMSTAEIAEKYGISPHHLAKVMMPLVRAGLLRSVRGVGGGYQLLGTGTTVDESVDQMAASLLAGDPRGS